jgi:hypothetical protein
MKPIKKQPVSDLLQQLGSYHDLSVPVSLPDAEVVGYNEAVAGGYNPQAIQDYDDRRKQSVFQRWMETDDDSVLEDVLELLDPTGYLSHDDFRAARQSWKESGRAMPTADEFLDMLGAVPMIGKAKLVGKIGGAGLRKSRDLAINIGRMLETAGFLQDRTQE